MALACLEGFDGLASISEIGLRSWRTGGAGSPFKFGATSGRRSSAGIYDDTVGSTVARYMEYHRNFFNGTPGLLGPSWTVGSGVVVGFAIKFAGAGWQSNINVVRLFSFHDSVGAEISSVYLQKISGTWRLIWGYGVSSSWITSAGNISLGGTDGFFLSDRWYYLTITNGNWQSSNATTPRNLFIDGSEVYHASNLVISADIATVPVFFRLGESGGFSTNIPSGCAIYYDDLYIQDEQTDYPAAVISPSPLSSTVIPPVRVDARAPNALPAVLSVDDFTSSSGAGTKSDDVDDVTQNGDTDYLYSPTTGHRQGFNLDASPFTEGTIYAVKMNAVIRREGDGVHTVRTFIANSTTVGETPSGGDISPGTSYEGIHTIGNTRSGSSNALTTLWTAANLTSTSGFTAGVKIQT